MKSLILLLSMVILSLLSFSQEKLILDDAIKIALQNNYSIKLIKISGEIADNNASIGNAGMLPTLNVNANLGASSNDSKLELSTGQSIDKKDNKSNNLGASAELNWTLFDGFAMFINYNKFNVLKDLSNTEIQFAIENTIYTLISLYYEALKLQLDLKSLNSNMQISRERLEKQKYRAEIGAGLSIEVLRAQVDLNRDSSAILQTNLALSNLKRNINYIIGQQLNTEFILDENINNFELFTLEYITESASKKNTSINNALINKQISEYDYKLIKSLRYPRIIFNTTYGTSKMTADAGMLTLNQNTGLSVGLMMSLNLFNGFKNNIQLQNMILSKEMTDYKYEDIKNQINLEIYNTYDEYIKRISIYELEKFNLITAEKNFIRSEELYASGQITSIELRDAQLNLLRSQNSINNALYQLKISEAELKHLAGLLLN